MLLTLTLQLEIKSVFIGMHFLPYILNRKSNVHVYM